MFCSMEIRVYASLDLMSKEKRLYCARVQDVDFFSFSDCLRLMKAIYGKDVIVVFVCV